MTGGETTTVTIIPAHPGWSLAFFIEGGKEPDGKEWEAHFALEPVIAWEIERTTGPYSQLSGRNSNERWVSRFATPITAEATVVETLGN